MRRGIYDLNFYYINKILKWIVSIEQGQSGQISTVHQKLVTFWNIVHMMIWNSLVEPFGVKYERPNLGQARLYIDRVSWPLFSGCHALTFCGFLKIWTRKIIKFLLFLV